MFSTHRDFPAPDPDIDPAYVALPPMIADTAANRADMAGFLTAARVLDRCVGLLLDALHESGQYRRHDDPVHHGPWAALPWNEMHAL